MAPPSRMIESLKQIQSHINTNKHLRSHNWHEALLNLKFSIYEGFDIRLLSKQSWLQRKEKKVHQSTMNGEPKNEFSTEIYLPKTHHPKTHQQANDTMEMSVKAISPSSSPTNHECTFANFSKGMEWNILLSNSIKHLRDQLLMPHDMHDVWRREKKEIETCF